MVSRLNWSRFLVLAILLVALSQFWCPSLLARETNIGQVKKMVSGWLTADARPLGAKLGQKIDKIDSFTDDAGNIVYYVVYLQPSGFVIVSADDLVEPIIGFVSKGSYDPSISNPLGALVSGDLSNRIASARSLAASAKADRQKSNSYNNRTALRKASLKALDKWSRFSSYETGMLMGAPSISDVWVEPLTQSTWGQTTVGGMTCYNHYTPENYPCGCAATAMAQLMRFYECPTVGIGVHGFTIRVDGSSQTAYTRGGNGSGGAYVWSNMPLQPDSSTITLTQREAIGALCYDAGVAIGTGYTSGDSSASLYYTDIELKNTFGYSNSICYYNPSSIDASIRDLMINPNLDAGCPVLLGIEGSIGGHIIVCDGYGYNASTLYHHLNMGWSGTDNAWYNLPTVDASYDFDTVHTYVYNVFTSGSGEIISGRVADLVGGAISDVNITATEAGGTYSTTTNSKGVYALANVPSNTSFTLIASKNNWSFSGKSTSTGQSTDYSGTPGNKWSINFVGIVSAGIVEFDKQLYLPSETIIITVVDNDLAGNGSVSVLVTTSGGDEETVSLSESPAGSGCFTASVPSAQTSVSTEDGTIQIGYNETITVTYEDVDDGTGNPATVQDTATTLVLLLEANFTGGLPSGWSIIDGGSSSHTWTSANMCSRSNINWNGTFMIADSRCAGPGVNMDEQLITPNLDCSSLEGVTIEFSHYLDRYYASNEICDVDVWVDSGPWQNIARYQYQGDDFSGSVKLDVSSIADGQSNVQIRWHYYDANWDNYWGIDNVQVTGLMLGPVPVAQDGNITAQSEVAETIQLHATDDGQPGPLTYIIVSLPSHGTLDDPQAGSISSVPYSLANNADEVVYTSDSSYTGPDEFTFKANDGGTVPDGGDSNIATITIEVTPNCVDITIGTGTSIWSFPMRTWYHDSRTQVIYLSSEIGKSGTITALALDVDTVPGQTMNNWTIRMNHTTISTYSTASLDASGWMVVYQGNEPPGSTGWRIFEFSTPFDYNDANNLLVDFSHNNDLYTSSGQCMCSTPGGTRSAYAYSDSDYGDPLDWSGTTSPSVKSTSNVPNIKLTICSSNYVGDFDEDGDVDTADLDILCANWLTNDPVVDIAPQPNGDGIVNFLDFALFAEHCMK